MVPQGPLTVAVSCHAWRVYRAARLDLFEETLATMRGAGYPFTLNLFTVGPSADDDGTQALVRERGGLVFDEPNSAGRAMNVGADLALATGCAIALLTADDFAYSPNWLARLARFWEAAPTEVTLACCHVEPDYAWATVRGVVEAGGEKALVRDTIPGSNWSFRVADWPIIGPVRAATGNEDIEICRRLTGMGRQVVALPLADHTGIAGRSSWGNRSDSGVAELDLRAWGLAP